MVDAVTAAETPAPRPAEPWFQEIDGALQRPAGAPAGWRADDPGDAVTQIAGSRPFGSM